MDDAAYERKVLTWLDKVRRKPQSVAALRLLLWLWGGIVVLQVVLVVGDFLWDRDYRVDPWGTFVREGVFRLLMWGALFGMQWLAYQHTRTLATVNRILDRERSVAKPKPQLQAPGSPP
jgi:hypothetical protein